MRRVLLLIAVLISSLVLTLTPAAVALAAPQPLTILLVPSASLDAKLHPDSELARTAQALQDWANSSLTNAWSLPPVVVKDVPRGSSLPPARAHQWVLNLVPYCDVVGALGYHWLSTNDVPYGEVGVDQSIMDTGNWTIAASHEIAEILVDPYANRFASNWAGTKAWFVEVGDPVETFSYPFGDRGKLYQMTDFVYPSFYDSWGRYPFDKLHLVTTPFEVLPGGYLTRVPIGPATQVLFVPH